MQEAAGSIEHVFISYAREDASKADGIQSILRAATIPVWRDTADLWPGEDWRTRIRQAINRDALVFIACFSKAGLQREVSYQNEEITLAVEQIRLRRPDVPWLIPVRFDDCVVPDRDIGGGRTLSSLQWSDIFGDQRESHLADLVAAVKRIMANRECLPAGEPVNGHLGEEAESVVPPVRSVTLKSIDSTYSWKDHFFHPLAARREARTAPAYRTVSAALEGLIEEFEDASSKVAKRRKVETPNGYLDRLVEVTSGDERWRTVESNVHTLRRAFEKLVTATYDGNYRVLRTPTPEGVERYLDAVQTVSAQIESLLNDHQRAASAYQRAKRPK